ncbi:Zn-dependent hydrolase [Zophobihabitans entericus]|uniref:Zn-dependent hydrolase n=1 Tax=Zophobihabitans entericus TaxID=1635327 RepID=A0A6G9IAC3_9GAMM|nr:Zn-dependent hydrolase [Zophobihabitans entericus]QIQ21185.1 Zn-dependent hydrolase [Zophobihabitans entericus]
MHGAFTEIELKQLFDTLTTFTANPKDKGQTRLAYTDEDERAHQYIMNEIQKRGLMVRQDAMGNVFARLPGKDSSLPAVGTGSHLDTVPQGGAYDGIIGVLSGIYGLLQFKPYELKRDLELVIFRAEESSRFGISCMGSKALVGAFDKEKWADSRDNQELNIFEAIDHAYYRSHEIESCLLPDNYFSAFIELHIEQGKCLEEQQKNIGIVTGIAAPTRLCIDIFGHADHSGATPMNQRQDALVAAAALITEVHHLANIESVHGTVGTVGKLTVTPNAINVIPGQVRFYVDIRGIELDSINRVSDGLKSLLTETAKQFDVRIEVKSFSQEQPVKLNPDVCQVIQNQCEKQHISYMTMLSGAGHDTMYMAQKYPAAMIFIPSYKGISHHHEEFSTFEDIMTGAKLLTASLHELANA